MKSLQSTMLVDKSSIADVISLVQQGKTLQVVSTATGYTRGFQHTDWIDFVDPVQAGGNNGFNERFHAVEHEFDQVASAIGSVESLLTGLQNAPAGIGMLVAIGLSSGAKIPVPSGYQVSETQFFAFPKLYQHTGAVGQSFGFSVSAAADGTVNCTPMGGDTQTITCTGVAVAKKGGWT